MTKPINWFEIPTSNIDKSTHFYETAFGIKMRAEHMEPSTLSVFPYDRETATKPGLGPVLYLNAGNELDNVIQRALDAGAKVVTPRTALPPLPNKKPSECIGPLRRAITGRLKVSCD